MTIKAEAVVYYPPKEGCPFLAAIISDGRVLACEPVKSLSEGEMVLNATMKELPRLIHAACLAGGGRPSSAVSTRNMLK
jgi:hypothetical protein